MKRLVKTLAVLAIMCLFGVFSVVGLFFYISMDLPQINSLKDYNPPMNSRIYSKDGEVLLDIGTETREVVAFDKIPKRVVGAFLAAEDDNFYNHEGIDYYGILRAFIVNMKEGRLVQGGSTITQQVAKSFLLTKERTISRKVKDLLLARKIEQKFSKDEILFLYLNQVYLGGGYYGVKAAFKGYFDKDLNQATPAEAALVAGLLVAPGRYSPYVNPQYAKVRQSYVLKRMFETKKITEEEYQAALKEDIKMRIRRTNDVKGGHFTDWIRQEVMRSVGTEEFLTNGFKVVTTLDWSLQAKAEKAVRDRVKELDKRQGFKGPIKQLASDEEIKAFLVDQRKSILREQSSFFTYTTEGKNIFEFHEDDDSLEKTFSYYEEEKEKLNERFKNLVEIGNSQNDPFLKFLQLDKTYQGVVLAVDDLKRTILVEIAGTKVIIPESGFDWAHERKFGEEPHWFQPQKTPSKILKRGAVVLVNIVDKSVPFDQLIHADFFKKYKDSSLRALLTKQKFIRASLDQDPEVEGALIALNTHTGEIVTLVGGVDFKKSQFNRVIQSSRQPGSAFKPFIYAAGLENGYTPSSILMDSPQALGGVDDSLSWKPRNYDGEFKGPMTFRSALEVSRNIPTVRLVQDLGVNKIHEFVNRFHIQAQIPKDMSLSLGSFGISLAELTKGYAVFPNGGKAVRLRHITSIKDRTGKSYPIPPADAAWPPEVEKPKLEPLPTPEVAEGETPMAPQGNPFQQNLSSVQVYDPRLAYVMTNLLRGVAIYGTAASAGKALGHNIGGKTGTTNNYVDALFVGFSETLAVGAWAGFDDNRPLGYGETGTRAALPIWIDYMSSAIPKYGSPDFPVPDGITNMLVNKQTGKLLPPGATEGFLESFVTGFDPNSDTQVFDPSSQSTGGKPSSIDDEGFWENQ
ncbi:penicillin-binding protein 1A [Peredibacter sp. HCB2-198]|uniref:penicillin-binding protein 1A n=1 Tax=Peredibacter sp. HCB2-198 TaxID=3383025 RepID=UPI0038B6A362